MYIAKGTILNNNVPDTTKIISPLEYFINNCWMMNQSLFDIQMHWKLKEKKTQQKHSYFIFSLSVFTGWGPSQGTYFPEA